MLRFAAFLVCLALVLIVHISDLNAAQNRSKNFEPTPCATFKIKSSEFECGYVSVPEFYAQPNGKKIKLAVAILPSTRESPTPDAFVMQQGGPGGSTLDLFPQLLSIGLFPALEEIRADRDIVLYDQRGTLYAQPSLVCPEDLELTQKTIEQEIPPDEALKEEYDAAMACRARLQEEGINLGAFNSIENAKDVESVRAALGYDRFDFYGISYGTLLALHAMRETPQSLRSVVLDAVVPAQINPNATVPQTMNRAFNRLFEACAADAECNRAYPDLKKAFYDQVDALNAKPARVPITDTDTDKTYNAALDGETYMNLLFQFIYNSELIPALPNMITEAREGRYTLIGSNWPLVAFDRTFASGMYYSTMCAEDADFTVKDLDLAGVDPHIAKSETRDTAAFLELCRDWNVPPLGARADEPVQSTIPTLILNGDFDPITPPPFGQAAGETIRPSYLFTFPAYGHGAVTSGNCPDEIMLEFIRDPEDTPNSSCIAEIGKVKFITPETTILSASLGDLLYQGLQLKLLPFILPIGLAVILASVLVVSPFAWFIGVIRKRKGDPHLLAKLMPWLSWLAAVLIIVFFVGLAVMVLLVVFNNDNTTALLLGGAAIYAPLFALPLLFAALTVGIVLIAVQAWRSSYWRVEWRVYYSVLAGAAAALTVWLYAVGALGALIGAT